MKQIYEIPEVTIFNVGVCEQMIAGSPGQTFDQHGAEDEEKLGNSNYMDDQSTPWYRR